MDLLILGGAGFIGRQLTRQCLEAGHRVTVVSRNASRLPTQVQILGEDRDGAFVSDSELDDQHWQVCIDLCGYSPAQMHNSLSQLAERVDRYIYLSSVQVYRETDLTPLNEQSPTKTAIADPAALLDNNSFGPLKVACEQVLKQVLPEHSCIIRPQVVTGPDDPRGHMAFWIERANHPRPTLMPGDGDDFLQVIDVFDLCRFILLTAEKKLVGTYNAAGRAISWRHFAKLLAVKNPAWVEAKTLNKQHLDYRALPLYHPQQDRKSCYMAIDNSKAINAGLTLTPMPELIERYRQQTEQLLMATDSDIVAQWLSDTAEQRVIASR